MKILWDQSSDRALSNPPRSYASYENAVKAAKKIVGDDPVPVIIAALPDGRFFPVAIGIKALQEFNIMHRGMCVAA